MKKISIICVGSLKEKYLKDAESEYLKRLKRYYDVEIICLQEAIEDNVSQALIEQKKNKEGLEILKKVKGYTIALCIDAKMYDSVALAKKIDATLDEFSQITFIIGGSNGLSDEVQKCANEKISFSPLTFPHQLMRIILLEQIYRAGTIIEGKTYHK